MIFVTTYKLKPFLTKADTKELMEAFATFGNTPGMKAHYLNADGGGGVVISESDDAAEAYPNILRYSPWIEFESKVMLPMEQAVQLIGEYIA